MYTKKYCHDIECVYNQDIERDDLQNSLLGLYPTELKGENGTTEFSTCPTVVVHRKKE